MENSSLRYVHDIGKNPQTSLAKLLNRIDNHTRILEIGPASGAMTKVLANEKQCQVSIVEMDKDCFDIAMQYAMDGVCCDFESYQWEKSFEENSYDYVIFADVLEHLRNPLEAIKRAKRYIKNEGSLLISVPNIGHNSIIIQLLNNQFIYHETGILDHTHIKHFTFSELEKLYFEAGYKPVYLDATYVAVGKNEFDVSYQDVAPEIEDILKKRPFGEVYQHICELKKEEYFEEYGLKTENRIGSPKTYVDINLGMKEKNEQLISEMPNYVFETNEEIAELRLQINDLYNSIPQIGNVSALQERIFEYQEEVRQKNNHIRILNESIEKGNQEIDVLAKSKTEMFDKLCLKDDEIRANKCELEAKDKELEARDKELEAKEYELQAKDYELQVKDRQINDKDVHIRNIESMLANVREPARKWNKLRSFFVFRLMRKGKNFARRVYHWTKKVRYKKLILPYYKNPKVSIVIPAYNQFEYTYACIKSIIENTKDCTYEVILGDDVSTDRTKEIKKIVKGIVVSRNKENLRFLRNCNNAATLARGEYILFLNNDTTVHPEWLSSLVELIESDESIGMVGSKLVYPDGTLQEAGGIIWNNANGWNYGRNQDASMPEYNYVREVDYISGAAIMISKKLWNEIGGFDELFNPAYCEDSDLAFQVRQHGYKVMYQPKSVVVHYEGISNGIDITSGVKKYQVENNKKFREKWKVELQNQYPDAYNPFKARERNFDKKTILIIDHYVPTFDKDAGSKTTFQYIKMFLKKGYCVKFVGDNYAQMEPYTTILQQLGVEVLYGVWYRDHIFEWIKEHEDSIDIAYLNRPHISEKYIDFIKNETNIKIIYYGHDLHFLRLQREAEVTGNDEKLKEANMWKQKELAIMRKAQMSFYPSYIEENAIHKIDPEICVKAITAYVFDEFDEDYKYDFKKREGILFVGGFSHGPNIDAVEWFAKEVYPAIYQETNAPFYIVGSNAPEEIIQLDGNGIVFKGFVSDEELKVLYANARMVVVPLRYGAGVKGKVVEALYNGLPIVTTSVGAEGIKGIENVVVIEDEPQDISNQIVSLYDDESKLCEMAMKTQQFVKDNFGMDAVWNIVKEDFE